MLIPLLLFWLVLSGQMSPFFFISAFISIIAIIYIDKKLFRISPILISINWHWFIFAAQLLKEIFLSAIDVMKIIWFKPASPCYTWVDTQSNNQTTQVIYANSITLTPGTMSMELKDNKILVHAISSEAMQEVQKASLENKILVSKL